jgi:glycosyltransferase involved in cell wall biosynthesis
MASKYKLKVAMVAPYPPTGVGIGGVENHVLNLTRELCKYSDIELHVVTPSNLAVSKYAITENITLHTVGYTRDFYSAAGLLAPVPKIVRKVREIMPAIVHGQSMYPVYALPTLQLANYYPTVLTVHAVLFKEKVVAPYLSDGIFGEFHPLHRIKTELLEIFGILALKGLQRIIAVTPYVKREVHKYSNAEITVIPNGVEDRYFETQHAEKYGRLLSVGLIAPRKGYEHLIAAVAKIKTELPDIELHIVGRVHNPVYFRFLKAQVKKFGVADKIKFMGVLSVEELVKEYSECSLFVLPSQEESQGIVLLEAMASGKPVVATRVGGIVDVVVNGRTGYLVEFGDPTALAESCITLLKNKHLRIQMGREGKKRAELYRWNSIAKKTVRLYHRIIQSKS